MRKSNFSGGFKCITTGTRKKDLLLNYQLDNKNLVDFGEELLEENDCTLFSLPSVFQQYQKNDQYFSYCNSLNSDISYCYNCENNKNQIEEQLLNYDLSHKNYAHFTSSIDYLSELFLLNTEKYRKRFFSGGNLLSSTNRKLDDIFKKNNYLPPCGSDGRRSIFFKLIFLIFL